MVFWIGCSVAYTNYRYPSPTTSDGLIQGYIDQVEDFFRWTDKNNIYDNIAIDISIDEVKNIVDAMLKSPSFIRAFSLTHIKFSNHAANTTSQQPPSLQVPPPAVNIPQQQVNPLAVNIPQQIPMQPAPDIQQPIQTGMLTSQDFKDYINSGGLSQQAKNILQSFGN